tara:strand:+ start:5405 stop:5620 length:216 start_codon:yes stop_codon:yes gene_type:complete
MYDIDTIQTIKAQIRKKINELKEFIAYSVDTIEELHYVRGKINALETLLQDLNDLQRKENNIHDFGDTQKT